MGIFMIVLGFLVLPFTGGSGFGIFISVLNIVLGSIVVWGQNDKKKRLKGVGALVDSSFESINKKLQKDSFPNSKAVDMELKMLDIVLTQPFKLKMNLNNDVLTIVGDKSNPPELYDQIGILKAPYYRIPINKIRYYVQEGEIISKTTGYGGGSSYSLVNGWNGKVNPVNISTTIEDTKHTRLYFEDENGKDIILTFGYDDFHTLKKIIPLKDYEIVQKSYINPETEVNQINTGDIKIKLQELKELRNQDLITDNEYDSKRIQLLDSL